MSSSRDVSVSVVLLTAPVADMMSAVRTEYAIRTMRNGVVNSIG